MGAKQKFKVGDTVRCVKADEYGELTSGKKYTVRGYRDGNTVNTKVTTDYGTDSWFYDHRFELVNSPKFKVGDTVRCIKSDYTGSLTLGKHYTVLGYRDNSDFSTKVTSDKGVNIWFYDYRFELVNSPKFKVGDRVRCVEGDHYGVLKEGHEYTIKNIISEYIYVDESEYGPTANAWLPERFKLVEDWKASEADVKDEEILAKAAEATAYPDDNPKTILGLSKPAIHTVPPISIFLQGQAMMDGEEKYGLMNWRHNGVTSSVYYNAAMRHLMAWWDGQENASDSNIHHLGHALACLGIIVDAQHGGTLNDDRPKPGTLPQFIDENTTNH